MSAITEMERPEAEGEDKDQVSEFQQLKKRVLAGHNQRAGTGEDSWIKESKRSYDFVAGRQWSDADRALLESQKRPPITFNRVAPIIKAVCGLEVNNRQEVAFLPREEGDIGVDETMTATARWVRQQCGAEDEESKAFRDNVICGEGWTETRMDYDEDPQGKIVQERVYPLEMGVGAGSYKANHENVRLIYRVRDMDVDDARDLLKLGADVLPAALHAGWFADQAIPADGGQGNKKDYPDKTRAGLTHLGKMATEVRIVQVQYWKRETVHLIAQEGQELQELTPEDFMKFEERAQQMAMVGEPLQYQAVTVPRRKYYECFLIADTIAGLQELKTGFTFKAMTGEYDEKQKCFYGMVRDMFDPQMWANKWLSQTMNILNANAKGGLMVESDAFVDPKKAEKDWSDPTKIITLKPGALQKQKIKERQAFQMPQGLDGLMAFAISSIRDVTGVNLELLGQADREQAASLEMQRRQSAMTILATMFDSLRRYRKAQGKLTLHFIYMLPNGTLIRVVEKSQIKYVPLLKDKDVEKYDIIIDEAPSAPDQKQFIWAITNQILQMNILPPAAVIELLRYSPYPESVVAAIRKAMGMGDEMPPEQMKQKLAQAEQALQVMEQELKKAMEAADTAEDANAIELMKIELQEYKNETDRLRARWDARAKILALGKVDPALGDESDESSNTALGLGLDQHLVNINNEDRAQPQTSGLEQKVDQLTQLVGQLVQAMGGGGQPPMAQPQPSVDFQGEQ